MFVADVFIYTSLLLPYLFIENYSSEAYCLHSMAQYLDVSSEKRKSVCCPFMPSNSHSSHAHMSNCYLQ